MYAWCLCQGGGPCTDWMCGMCCFSNDLLMSMAWAAQAGAWVGDLRSSALLQSSTWGAYALTHNLACMHTSRHAGPAQDGTEAAHAQPGQGRQLREPVSSLGMGERVWGHRLRVACLPCAKLPSGQANLTLQAGPLHNCHNPPHTCAHRGEAELEVLDPSLAYGQPPIPKRQLEPVKAGGAWWLGVCLRV